MAGGKRQRSDSSPLPSSTGWLKVRLAKCVIRRSLYHRALPRDRERGVFNEVNSGSSLSSNNRLQALLLLPELQLPTNHIQRLPSLHRVRQSRDGQRDPMVRNPVLCFIVSSFSRAQGGGERT